MLPPVSNLLLHPFSAASDIIQVIKLTAEDDSMIASERRRKKMDDVKKQKDYQQAHGIKPDASFLRLLGAKISTPPSAVEGTSSSPEQIQTFELEKDTIAGQQIYSPEERRPKRWLGIW